MNRQSFNESSYNNHSGTSLQAKGMTKLNYKIPQTTILALIRKFIQSRKHFGYAFSIPHTRLEVDCEIFIYFSSHPPPLNEKL